MLGSFAPAALRPATAVALACILTFLLPIPASGQWSDDFSDGDFSHDPEWVGTSDRFTIFSADSKSWLRSRGLARADTIYLATPSNVAYGTWRFRFRFDGVNLSNFNGARVFVLASTNNLSGDVEGYYLQFGTNNSNEIRLFRIDGDHSRRRVEIGRYTDPVLAGTQGDFEILLRRDTVGRFDLFVEGIHGLSVIDNTYTSSHFAGVWIKHTSASAESYLFTDFSAAPPGLDDGGGAPIDDRPDRPSISGYSADGRNATLTYSTAMSSDVCDADVYELDSEVVLTQATCSSSKEVQISIQPWLDDGNYGIRAIQVRDSGGGMHELVGGILAVRRGTDDPGTPSPIKIIEVRHTLRESRIVRITFSGSIDEASLPAASIRLDAMIPLHSTLEESGRVVRAELPATPDAGEQMLSIEGLRAANGHRIDTLLTVHIKRAPLRRELVINEVHYDPPDQALEFFELYNRSQSTFDAEDLDYSDDRIQKTPLAGESRPIGPGEYLVFVRNGPVFEASFPGVPYVQPSTWHVLNNPGDAVVVFAGDAVVDSVHYTSAWGGRHVSLERIDPDGPSVRANFGSSIDPFGATPGRQNSIFNQDASRGSIVRAAQRDSNTIILYPDRALGSSNRESPHLECPPALISSIDVLDDRVELAVTGGRPTRCSGDGIVDALERPLLPFDIEVALMPVAGELLINEVMFDPLTDPHDGKPDQPFYVEIISASEFLLSLAGVAISGSVSETGAFTRIDHQRQDAVLVPGGYAVFSTENGNVDDVDREGALASAFPQFSANGSSSVLLPVRRSTLGMRRGGDPIRLIRADSTQLDATILHPSLHHPALRETRGRSLERRSTLAPSEDPSNWASSTHRDGGTPGGPNSIGLPGPNVSPQRDFGLQLSSRVFAPDEMVETNHVRIDYRLRSSASSVRARVFDSRGRLVRTIEHGAFSGSEGAMIWEGHDDDRRALPVGIYIVVLDAVDVTAGVSEQYRDTVVLGRHLRR
jgi:hypothetical protein